MVELRAVEARVDRREMNLAGNADHLEGLLHEPERAPDRVRIRPQRPRQALETMTSAKVSAA